MVLMSMLILDQALIVKCLHVYKWNIMSRLDDNFFSTYLGLVNGLLAVAMFFLRLASHEYESNIHASFFAGLSAEAETPTSKWAISVYVPAYID